MTTTEEATMGTKYTTKRSSELARGDVVYTHGLRVRVGEVKVWGREPEGPVYTYAGEILNPEYLATDEGRSLFAGITNLDGSEGWSIQGNDRANWAVEA